MTGTFDLTRILMTGCHLPAMRRCFNSLPQRTGPNAHEQLVTEKLLLRHVFNGNLAVSIYSQLSSFYRSGGQATHNALLNQ